MATLNLEIPGMDEIGVIRYLLDEIEAENEYNKDYAKSFEKAKTKAEKAGGYSWDYMDRSIFDHEPRESVINDNIKIIRRLLLKIRKR